MLNNRLNKTRIMRILYEVSGGIAGIRRTALINTTVDLSKEEVAELHRIIEETEALREEDISVSATDTFNYEIRLEYNIKFSAPTPGKLGPLIDFIEKTGGLHLHLTTDKPEYNIGDPVMFTAKNSGRKTLVFPDSALGITIKNIDNNKDYSIAAAQVLTSIEPGKSRDVKWNNTNDRGRYVATIHTAAGTEPSGTAVVNFEIR
jgi:hypothetical protein